MTMHLTASPLAIEKREAKKSRAEKNFECNTQYFYTNTEPMRMIRLAAILVEKTPLDSTLESQKITAELIFITKTHLGVE